MNRFSFNKLLITLQLVSVGCAAQIIEDFQYQYYPVNIQANQEYHQATVKASPFKFHDSTAIGVHRVNFRWEWKPEIVGNENKCRLANFTLYHKTRIDLPELTGSPNNEQSRQFHYYLELIKQHELEHYYIAKNYAQIFEQRIINELGSYDKCSEIDGEIKRIFDTAMIELSQQQDEFDQRDYKISKIKEVENILRRHY